MTVKYWNRVSLLRKLVTYFESIGVTSQEKLAHWANTSDFEKDFSGKIPGMSFAIYQWLIDGDNGFSPLPLAVDEGKSDFQAVALLILLIYILYEGL